MVLAVGTGCSSLQYFSSLNHTEISLLYIPGVHQPDLRLDLDLWMGSWACSRGHVLAEFATERKTSTVLYRLSN